MGNNVRRMSSLFEVSPSKSKEESNKFESVNTYQFHEIFTLDTNNGLYLNSMYIPEEIVTIILTYVNPPELLRCSEVCKRWCNIIKSDPFWANVYNIRYRKKPKKLPWYVYYCLLATDYFDKNLIKNGNGQDNYKHWKIMLNYGDQFRIENPPCGADPLPTDVPEFNGKSSCFATSYYECNKLQEFSLEKSRLMQLIFNKYKPHIYVSEWVAGRFDCGCVYTLWCRLYGSSQSEPLKRKSKSSDSNSSSSEADDEEVPLHAQDTRFRVEQWAGSPWTKVEMIVKDYPSGVKRIIFQHEGRDTQFWKGHYGSKMAGGVLKILFDSIEPLT